MSLLPGLERMSAGQRKRWKGGASARDMSDDPNALACRLGREELIVEPGEDAVDCRQDRLVEWLDRGWYMRGRRLTVALAQVLPEPPVVRVATDHRVLYVCSRIRRGLRAFDFVTRTIERIRRLVPGTLAE